ncbi:hypothetical protein Holit_01664 [Hollandina sp. SP2]
MIVTVGKIFYAEAHRNRRGGIYVPKKYKVPLTADEKALLYGIINRGKHGAGKGKGAQGLLVVHEGYSEEKIGEGAGMHGRGIEGLWRRFVEDGFEISLEGKSRGHRHRVLTGEDEARLIGLVCGPHPEGCTRWTMQLLTDTCWVPWNTLIPRGYPVKLSGGH